MWLNIWRSGSSINNERRRNNDLLISYSCSTLSTFGRFAFFLNLLRLFCSICSRCNLLLIHRVFVSLNLHECKILVLLQFYETLFVEFMINFKIINKVSFKKLVVITLQLFYVAYLTFFIQIFHYFFNIQNSFLYVLIIWTKIFQIPHFRFEDLRDKVCPNPAENRYNRFFKLCKHIWWLWDYILF